MSANALKLVIMIDLIKLKEKFDILFETETSDSFHQWLKERRSKEIENEVEMHLGSGLFVPCNNESFQRYNGCSIEFKNRLPSNSIKRVGCDIQFRFISEFSNILSKQEESSYAMAA